MNRLFDRYAGYWVTQHYLGVTEKIIMHAES